MDGGSGMMCAMVLVIFWMICSDGKDGAKVANLELKQAGVWLEHGVGEI